MQLSPAIAIWIAVLSQPVAAQATSRVSVDSSGQQSNGASGFWFGQGNALSADGRFVAFYSLAADLVAGDTNGCWDVFVRDRLLGTTERVSVDSSGAQGMADSFAPSLSADGRFVAFSSVAANLVPGDTNSCGDIFVRDRLLGTTERVSVDSAGVQANAESSPAFLSADGRWVAFTSLASNLVLPDLNGGYDLYVHDRLLGTTERASVDSAGAQALGDCTQFRISADGRYVAFGCLASNLVAGDTNGVEDIFVRDRMLGTTERVSLDSAGAQSNGASRTLSISADGRFVAFGSEASNLAPNDTNGVMDVFLRDRLLGTTERVSVGAAGQQGNGLSIAPALSDDGSELVFESLADNLFGGDNNGCGDVLVRHGSSGAIEPLSVATDGTLANASSSYPAISGDGRSAVFASLASNLVAADTNATSDIFVRGPVGAPFADDCDPGTGGVQACPCANPPSGAARGCDNSAATGGASLSASGVAFLSQDTLLLSSSGELPNATSIVLQGSAELAAGAAFGQGVRCAGGVLKRLFVAQASGGAISVPDPAAGDPPLSLRSAALGDPIHPGESRWYLVYYRDPQVLGGCPAANTFNATQTIGVEWWY